MTKRTDNLYSKVVQVVAFVIIMALGLPPPASTVAPNQISAAQAQAITPGLKLSGNSLQSSDGSRFVVSGVNMEMYRDYDNGCGWVTDGTYAIRGVMADKVNALGINAVRLNYAYRFLNQSGNLTRFLDMAQELADRGIYVMPSDHTYTGGVLTLSGNSLPMMTQIVEGMRSRGLESYLIMNPWNEPGPDISVSAWVNAQKNVLLHLRVTTHFNGVVVLDGIGWSTMLDVTAFKQVMDYDASITSDGKPNVMFSNHLYPNISGLPSQIWASSSSVPLVVGELGQENPGASPLDPGYVKNTISGFFSTGMGRGHNGLFAWILQWCDTNKMMNDWEDPSVPYTASSTLSSHGKLWVDNYYTKLPSSPQLPTVVPVTVTPTRTRTAVPATPTRTRTPVRSSTPVPPTPTRTSTPVRTVVLTSTPSQDAMCLLGQVEIEIKVNGQIIVVCGYLR